MPVTNYTKSSKYQDLDTIYEQCSGPGGLKLAEFIADKLSLKPRDRLLDIGFNQGCQTCFLAKEYDIDVVGIDPWHCPQDGIPFVDYLMRNARSLGVQNRILAIKTGVPDTKFADNSFKVAYSTTALEMIRGIHGECRYRECLAEILRVLQPGALFGYGDPMHLDVPLPSDLAPLVEKCWGDCFATLDETVEAFHGVGFEVIEADYAPDARLWWEEYAQHDPGCLKNPDGDPLAI